ncbi:putative iron-dependent peroxidase [Pseudoalteromonas ulvae UL12]|uniref:Dyp-type peroxidase n=1 Tax=Pseudoalteromonas ulvae TaxID=107327 RepID=UPI00186BAED8|nr:Dyp-type peroxidase [Pseudoalteromonas ulvae]MBE0363025.1 putative iron-dependent peroxidase [Pseudoalteromonas ulvae UL12]
MPQAQSGICAEANLHGLYLFLNVLDGHDESVAKKFAQIIDLQDDFSDQFSEALLSSVVAIGAEYWPHLIPTEIPDGLVGFPQVDDAEHNMPSQPFDLFIQIRSDRSDVNHLFGLRVLNLLAPDVELVEQVKCFRFLDGRDLNGFIYGADVPHGRAKKRVALIEDVDSPFHQGSFVHIQRFRHNLNKWQLLSIDEQEAIIGRTRLDNDLIEPINSGSHVHRFELKDSQGNALLLQQGMPYGDMHEQGMLQVSCSANSEAFLLLLKNRLDSDQGYDSWLDFTSADMGASFFAPSIDFLTALAKH